ncbi:MAG TPA: DUF6764 family protein [Aldersonia sp.]
MRVGAAIVCGSALVCGSTLVTALIGPVGVAGAQPAQCMSSRGTTMTIIDGLTACGSETDPTGWALAYGSGGIGYAKADAGASAVGIGLDGGVGASQGAGGTPTALGIGPDSVAITSVDGGAFSLAFALANSQALAADADQGVVCHGPGALAWNAAAGLFCVASPVGTWTYR